MLVGAHLRHTSVINLAPTRCSKSPVRPNLIKYEMHHCHQTLKKKQTKNIIYCKQIRLVYFNANLFKLINNFSDISTYIIGTDVYLFI